MIIVRTHNKEGILAFFYVVCFQGSSRNYVVSLSTRFVRYDKATSLISIPVSYYLYCSYKTNRSLLTAHWSSGLIFSNWGAKFLVPIGGFGPKILVKLLDFTVQERDSNTLIQCGRQYYSNNTNESAHLSVFSIWLQLVALADDAAASLTRHHDQYMTSLFHLLIETDHLTCKGGDMIYPKPAFFHAKLKLDYFFHLSCHFCFIL